MRKDALLTRSSPMPPAAHHKRARAVCTVARSPPHQLRPCPAHLRVREAGGGQVGGGAAAVVQQLQDVGLWVWAGGKGMRETARCEHVRERAVGQRGVFRCACVGVAGEGGTGVCSPVAPQGSMEGGRIFPQLYHLTSPPHHIPPTWVAWSPQAASTSVNSVPTAGARPGEDSSARLRLGMVNSVNTPTASRRSA